MSLINTNDIWLALGDFFDLFPDDERVYWSTFWEAYSDIVADLWGLAFQVDRSKSLFETTATFERREVLVKVSNLTQGLDASFRISSLREESGYWILRGFVPRDLRSFKATDLPGRGLIRIGVDLIPYSQVNATTIVGGVYDDFVREAAFTLTTEPPHDYSDDPEFNDNFAQQSVSLNLRVNHVAGGLVVDAVGSGTVNPSGIIQMGTAGINSEAVEYESVTIVGGRYVFQLAQSWQTPDTNAEDMAFDHANAEPITVYRHDPGRWTQRLLGQGRVVSRGDARLIIDNELIPVASRVELLGQYQLRDSNDFDISTTVSLDTWQDPTILSTAKRVYARANVGPIPHIVGIESRMTGAGVEHVALSGPESAPTESPISELPARVEFRFKRVGGVMEFHLRDTTQQSYQVLSTTSVSGLRTTMDMVIDDPNTQTASSVAFDEALRRVGEIVGNQRLEEFFSATDVYPHVYAIDQNLTQAPELRDRPRVRTEELTTVDELIDDATTVVRGRGADEDFEPLGVSDAGLLTIGGHQVIYDQIVRNDQYIEFHLRRKMDPDLFPVAIDTSFTVSTRSMVEDEDYQLTGDGFIELKELPTRDRFWAPVAQVDVRHVQNHFGVLTDLDADISSQTYLNRVQGTWFALMDGPAFRNVHSGLQLAMGLPVAKVAGTVLAKRDYRDDLGRLVKRDMLILSSRGEIVHELDPNLYPFIDWSVNIGEIVDQFQPLTNGVEVLDVISDPLWHERFPGIADIERFNTFGIFVAIEALSADASVYDAVRFALRIKPTYTKMAMRFLLTSGNEDLSDELRDDLSPILLPHLCEDMTMPEGQAPDGWDDPLTLGDGHKLGQAKNLGGTGQWHPATLGTYKRQGPFEDDGQLTAGSDILEASGAFSFVDADRSTGSTVEDSGTFSDAGAPLFTSADVGKDIVILSGADAGAHTISGFLSPNSVTIAGTFTATDSSLDWRLRGPGFQDQDLGKNIHVTGAASPADDGDHKIVEVIDRYHVRLLKGFAGFANTETVTWEIRDYVKLDDLATLGQITAYRCLVPADHEPNEVVDSQQIVTVAVGP